MTRPATSTNHVTSYVYDHGLGVLLQSTDENSVSTYAAYDGFGRVVAVWAPGDTPNGSFAVATVVVSYAVLNPINGNTAFRVQLGRRKDPGGAGYARRQFEWRYYDGIGRLVQTQTDFDRSGMTIHAQDLNEIQSKVVTYKGSSSVAAVTAGTSLIHASDFTGLQSDLQSLWTTAGLGPMPSLGTGPVWSSGVTPANGASRSPIYQSDVVDLRLWLNEYKLFKNIAVSDFQYPPGTSPGNVQVVNRFYDGRGVVTHESVPHLQSMTVPGRFAWSDWTIAANPTTSYTYDSLKRELIRTQPDGAQSGSSYAGFTTTVVDENLHQKVTTANALGQLSAVKEYQGTSPSAQLLNTTSYVFDVGNHLLSVTDQAGNVTTLTYDSLGRKMTMADPDFGLGGNKWTYSYYPLGTLAQQNDAKTQAINYTYDVLDRLTGKSGTNLATIGYAYDTGSGAYLIGRRASMTDGPGSVTYSYDQRGRLVALTRVISGTSYLIATTYDALDRILTVTYPSPNNDVVSYVYGDHGMPTTLLLNGTPLVNGALYNALGKLKTLPLGNRLTTSYSYFGIDVSPSGSPYAYYGRLSHIQTGSVQNQTFPATGVLGYDETGNVMALSYADHTAESFTFTYNELDQLKAMAGSAAEGYGSYIGPGSYDVGNLLAKGSAVLTYPAGGLNVARPHAPTTVSTLGAYGYDANGNRASDPSYSSFTYDGENHLTVLGSPAALTNTYDGDGGRVARVVGSTTTHYVGQTYENDPTAQVATVYYQFGGVPVAMKKGNTLYYLHHDDLGSLVSVTDASGNEQWWGRYFPFGGLRLSTGSLPTDRLFTGQIRDLGNDAYYFFKARYYDATIGCFPALGRERYPRNHHHLVERARRMPNRICSVNCRPLADGMR